MSTNSSLVLFLGLFPWIAHIILLMIGQPLPVEALHILLSGLAHWLNWPMALAIPRRDVHWSNCELEVCNKDSWLCRLKIRLAFIASCLSNFSVEKLALYDVTKFGESALFSVPVQMETNQFLQKGENPGTIYSEVTNKWLNMMFPGDIVYSGTNEQWELVVVRNEK